MRSQCLDGVKLKTDRGRFRGRCKFFFEGVCDFMQRKKDVISEPLFEDCVEQWMRRNKLLANKTNLQSGLMDLMSDYNERVSEMR